MNHRIIRATVAFLLTIASVLPAFAQQTTLGPAPSRQYRAIDRNSSIERISLAAAGVDVTPFDRAPLIKLIAFQGNVGDGVQRTLSLRDLNSFTSPTLDSQFVRVAEFEVLSFTTAAGTTTIGRPGKVSWVEAKVEQPGWIVIRYWIQGVTIQTLYECHFSAGAVEGQLALYRNTENGLCRYETWSTPEGLAVSSLGTRINKGSFAGQPSLMFADFCFWRFKTWDGLNNVLSFNQQKMVGETFIWEPLQVEQQGFPGQASRILFDIFRVEVTL